MNSPSKTPWRVAAIVVAIVCVVPAIAAAADTQTGQELGDALAPLSGVVAAGALWFAIKQLELQAAAQAAAEQQASAQTMSLSAHLDQQQEALRLQSDAIALQSRALEVHYHELTARVRQEQQTRLALVHSEYDAAVQRYVMAAAGYALWLHGFPTADSRTRQERQLPVGATRPEITRLLTLLKLIDEDVESLNLLGVAAEIVKLEPEADTGQTQQAHAKVISSELEKIQIAQASLRVRLIARIAPVPHASAEAGASGLG